jgi:hypothetical protein
MKILMITEKDAGNASLARISQAFLRRGHKITIYALYYASNVLDFFPADIPKYPFDQLTAEIVNMFDAIFTTVAAGDHMNTKGILLTKKPIFAQNYLIDKQLIWGGDICFVPSLQTVKTEYDEYQNYSKIAIGEPKYDSHWEGEAERNEILFIDSGHYPFGIKGKLELAKVLLHVCKKCPEYDLVIKPRFLPSDTVTTHKNRIHLYDLIKEEVEGEIPPNLIMLEEHKDLKELIDRSHTVICMYTTAFVGAVVAKKGLIILDNLPSEDSYDVRWKNFKRIREHMLDSGALVNYKEIDSVLPNGIKSSDEYRSHLLTEYMEVSEKICEVVEHIWDTYYSKGKLPSKFICKYGEHKEALRLADSINWSEIVKRRCLDYVLRRVFIQIDFHVKAKLNIDNAIDRIKLLIKDMEHFTKEGLEELGRASILIRNECIADNGGLLMKDSIDQGILMNSLFLLKRYDDIKSIPYTDIGSYHYFRGMVAYMEGDYEYAYEELLLYMDETLKREFIKEISDMSDNKFLGFYRLILLLLSAKRYEESYKFYEHMKRYFAELYPLWPAISNNISEITKRHYSYIQDLEFRFDDSKFVQEG